MNFPEQALRPDLIISVGTAGGFAARGAAIGDVFVATGFANHDRRIPLPVQWPTRGLHVVKRREAFCVVPYVCYSRLEYPFLCVLEYSPWLSLITCAESICGCAWHVLTCPGFLQGFDKYGVWACGAHPVPNLQKALNLKVQLTTSPGPACLLTWLEFSKPLGVLRIEQ